ncbi:MAG: undecaprenyl/decaprenyl-phosphate alpha-N-acetylglucosaminyl 1-phosphate transferase [Phycisphaerales bacterium]|jgi:UDP-GlcNAc:undecaprenyl-phosphate GlcNAc-1-phosphate transferase|nr:undecaprenyl/decaprenyl-phosphate alpha-N-acetylglucosaminyl 1-phosphate transferase [Phycisphaerales bacterium]
MIAPIVSLCGVSFVLSWLLTAAMKRIAPRIGFVDKPGHRKIHVQPKPLGGGVAIFWAFALPVVAVLVVSWFAQPQSADWMASVGGVRLRSPLAWAILGCTFAIHLLGLIDDKKALGPYIKLLAQLAITAFLVVEFDLRILTALGDVASVVLTILWITAITNAFNFLDNMDGLSAGVAAVCTAAFMVTALSIGQWFVAANLALLLGALLGFLCFNFSPASIFMGDSGSLVIGFLLGILTVRTTFLPPDTQLAAGWYSLFAPIIVLALPLYDLIVVSIIRMSRGKSPFVGDTNHFSHRLVARGMSKRTAVLCIYLVTAATAIAAMLLPHVQSTFAAILIVIQTLLVLGVVALLEQHPLPTAPRAPADSTPASSQPD